MLSSRRLLPEVLAFARAQQLSLYLVGGFLRDALLGRSKHTLNIDFAIASQALAVGRRLAQAVGGSFVCLDEEAGSARVVVGEAKARVELDLSDFRAPTLESDLAKRDFTVNAMALPLERWCAGPGWERWLIDPLRGRDDLAAKRLRACFPETFLEDPVRILRACRFAVELDFTLEPSLGPLMASAATRLARISGERVRDELLAIFTTDRAHWALAQLNEVGVLDVLFPELLPGRGMDQGTYHHLDVLGHQLETVAQGDRMMTDFAEFAPELREPLRAYAAVELVEKRSRKALIKLAGLYHDVGKPATRRVKEDGEIWFLGHEQFGQMLAAPMTERLRLSNREAEMIRRLVLSHLRPGHLSREPQLTRRAIFRFFRDLDEDGPACLLLWWTDRMATRGSGSHLDQIDQQRMRLSELLRAYFFHAEEVVKPPRLVDGHALMRALTLASGPKVGEVLRLIQEAQAEGTVRTTDEALALARRLVQSMAD